MRWIIAMIALILGSNAWAKAHLVMRADQYHPYNLPHLTLMPNMNVACNDQVVSVRYWQVNDDEIQSGIRTLNYSDETYVDSHLYEKSLIVSMPSLNENNQALFAINSQFATKGIFVLTSSGEAQVDIPDSLMSARALTDPRWWMGKFLVRRLSQEGFHQLWHGDRRLLDVEKNEFVMIHLPQVRGTQVVFSAMKGEAGDITSNQGSQIMGLNKLENTPQVLVVDSKINPESAFTSFDTSPQPAGNGDLVFIGSHKTYGRSIWFRQKSGDLFLVARENQNDIEKIEYFSPQINSRGDVLFRGIDSNGKRHVFHWNFSSKHLRSLMIQGQTVFLNDSTARVMDRPKWPAFSGRPCLTDSGQVFIHAVLESTNGKENKGSGIFQIIETD